MEPPGIDSGRDAGSRSRIASETHSACTSTVEEMIERVYNRESSKIVLTSFERDGAAAEPRVRVQVGLRERTFRNRQLRDWPWSKANTQELTAVGNAPSDESVNFV